MPDKSAVEACLNALSARVAGELRTDEYNRMFYSTDASIYQVQPLAVLIPRNRGDVHAAVEACAEFGVPLLPRASGSSLAGQAIGEAVIVDFTRHLNRVLEVDRDRRRVTVEPGVVLGDLNRQLKPLGLQFGPDPASANRAAIGGIVANNSTGAHSILYGMTADHVREMDVVLSDGSRTKFGPMTEEALTRGTEKDTRAASVIRGLRDLVRDEAHAGTIRERTPRHWRRCGGYNLDRFVATGVNFRVEQEAAFNPARLICGSEGTLAIIEDVTLDLVPLPTATALAVVHFDELHAALEAVPPILETDPSAIELLDHLGMSLCRNVPAWRRKLEGFVDGDPDCVLITEFEGENEAELVSRIDRLKDRLGQAVPSARHVVSVHSAAGQADVWSVRKMGLGFLMSMKGDHKPIPFIEDAAVPVEHLADYVTGIERFCGDLGVKVAYYAHASAGCVHIRPLVNTKDATEIARLPEITSFAIEQLHGFGGALSSEHGDGRARSAFNEQFFGPELYGLFRDVKRLFDPENIFNPGNIVGAGPMTENLRFGPEYRTRTFKTHLDFSADEGFDRAVEMCNGAGVCRKTGDGTMCPSFMATREEEHSTRGRANALRAVLSGRFPSRDLGDRRLYETLDLCLECKACASECPSSVDMAKLKMEFLAQYQDRNGVPLRSRMFGDIAETAGKNTGLRARLANAVLRRPSVRWGLEKTVGITRHRAMPPFATVPFTEWFSARAWTRGRAGQVVLFNDTFNTYNYPSVARSATEILEACGYEVILPGHRCCGRPMLSKGMLEEARVLADETLDALFAYAEEGIPIVGLEPSCYLSFDDEYRSLFPGDRRVDTVVAATGSLEAFLTGLAAEGKLPLKFTAATRDVVYHGHCHLKSLAGTSDVLEALRLPANYTVREVASGCCGMAGSFGFEKEHYDLSMQIGEDRLFPAVREAEEDVLVCASGVSCRQQIEHGTGRSVLHPAELLREAIAPGEST
jgi:FAD/FMN-containing dehydrogenase/Fe-S oxidoreductase